MALRASYFVFGQDRMHAHPNSRFFLLGRLFAFEFAGLQTYFVSEDPSQQLRVCVRKLSNCENMFFPQPINVGRRPRITVPPPATARACPGFSPMQDGIRRRSGSPFLTRRVASQDRKALYGKLLVKHIAACAATPSS